MGGKDFFKTVCEWVWLFIDGLFVLIDSFTIAVQKELLLKAGFGEVEMFYENIKLTGSGAVSVAKK